MAVHCGTDYSPPCGTLPLSFVQMLAACMVNYIGCDIQGTPHTFLNLIPVSYYCDDLQDFWTCARQGPNDDEALAAMAANLFALDDCGRLGLKVFWNYGEAQS